MNQIITAMITSLEKHRKIINIKNRITRTKISEKILNDFSTNCSMKKMRFANVLPILISITIINQFVLYGQKFRRGSDYDSTFCKFLSHTLILQLYGIKFSDIFRSL